jgi:hypothetical protein
LSALYFNINEKISSFKIGRKSLEAFHINPAISLAESSFLIGSKKESVC